MRLWYSVNINLREFKKLSSIARENDQLFQNELIRKKSIKSTVAIKQIYNLKNRKKKQIIEKWFSANK